MTHIAITIGYEPNLKYYPGEVETKRDAMDFDANAWSDGLLGLADLIEFADEVDVQVVDE